MVNNPEELALKNSVNNPEHYTVLIYIATKWHHWVPWGKLKAENK